MLPTNGTIGKEIGANGKNSNTIAAKGTNVTNQWYHWENPEHTHFLLSFPIDMRGVWWSRGRVGVIGSYHSSAALQQ